MQMALLPVWINDCCFSSEANLKANHLCHNLPECNIETIIMETILQPPLLFLRTLCSLHLFSSLSQMLSPPRFSFFSLLNLAVSLASFLFSLFPPLLTEYNISAAAIAIFSLFFMILGSLCVVFSFGKGRDYLLRPAGMFFAFAGQI